MSNSETSIRAMSQAAASQGSDTRKQLREGIRKVAIIGLAIVGFVLLAKFGYWVTSDSSSSGQTLASQHHHVIGRDGYLRLVGASGSYEFHNQFSGQCLTITPESKHERYPFGGGYLVIEPRSNREIYTMTWSKDGFVTYVDIAKGREETITVTTKRVGEMDCG